MNGRPEGSKNTVIHIWSAEEKEFLKKITQGHHYKEIRELVNEKFNLDLTLSQIKGAIGRYKLNTGFNGHFQKGSIPANKGKKGIGGWEPTQWKKGHKPHNYLPIGTERVNGDGYVDIKIADPHKWRCKHTLIWEEHNGPLPKGHVVIFGDGDRNNFELDNLILVSRHQLLIMNKNKLIKSDADLTRTGVVIANLYKKISERKSNKISAGI